MKYICCDGEAALQRTQTNPCLQGRRSKGCWILHNPFQFHYVSIIPFRIRNVNFLHISGLWGLESGWLYFVSRVEYNSPALNSVGPGARFSPPSVYVILWAHAQPISLYVYISIQNIQFCACLTNVIGSDLQEFFLLLFRNKLNDKAEFY